MTHRRMRQPARNSLAIAVSATLSGAAFFGAAGSATAQEVGSSPAEIVITGSRIKRDDTFDAPVPLAVVDSSAIASSGITLLGDALGNLPQALAGVSLQNSSNSLFNTGQSRVDLRGLGSARTLLLVDGRRHLTGDFRTSSVDLNMIPSTMIDRVEAISGGASAVYGSEAIAGVVNVILKKEMDGAILDVQAGMTGEGDGDELKVGVGYGIGFADGRGSFLIGGEFASADPIYQVDRSWAYPGVRRNTNLAPQTIVQQSRSNLAGTATFQFVRSTTNPSLERSSTIARDRSTLYTNSPECRTTTVSPLCQDPWLNYLAQYNVLQSELERRALRTYIDFDIGDSLTVFADLSFAQVDGLGISVPVFSNAGGGGTMPVLIRGDYAYLNSGTPLAGLVRAHWLAALPAGTTTLTRADTAQVGKIWEEFGMRNSDTHRESYRLIGGFEGHFELADRKVDWNFHSQYSRLTGSVVALGVPYVARVQQATDAVLLNGQIVCNDAGARAQGCQPWDLINGPSPAAVGWASATARTDGAASQTVLGLNANTSLFDLPAGALAVAMGGEYREEKSDQVQDPISESNQLFYNVIGRTKGQYHVREAYTEIVVPLLRDLPGAHRLSVEGAGRIGDYSTVGGVKQWRLQATWAPVEDVSFRGSKSVAVRAPNITELFAPQSRNFTTTANDPCDRAQVSAIANDPGRQAIRIANCAAAIPGYTYVSSSNGFQSNIGTGRPSLPILQGGNPQLFEEAAETLTVGMVVRPRFVSDLSLSIDYWKIQVDDAINLIPINTLLANLCYDVAQPIASNRFCQLIRRDPTGTSTSNIVGGVAEVTLTNQNVQSIETSGIDVAIRYSHAVGGGTIQLQFDATKVTRWDLTGIPGGPVTHYAGTLTGVNGAVPEYKASAGLGWTSGNFSLQWQTRFQDSYGVSEIDPSSSRDPFYTGNYYEHDLRGTYELASGLTLRAGINNLSDEHPPLLPEVGNGTSAQSSTYDNRGRWYYAGVNYKFGKRD